MHDTTTSRRGFKYLTVARAQVLSRRYQTRALRADNSVPNKMLVCRVALC